MTGSPEAAGQGGSGGRPLLGIPLSVKDIVDVAGMTTTSGSKFPHEAARSAPAWRRLSEAGAILLGKNNLQEFAFGVSGDNPTFGRTRNPHDPARIPGGSSSGSAVAVATGMGYGSVGTDTGGSIRIPASLNGVFGLKPSYGAVSRAGVTPLSWSLDHVGPIARSAADIGLLFGVLSGWSSGPAGAARRGSEAPRGGAGGGSARFLLHRPDPGGPPGGGRHRRGARPAGGGARRGEDSGGRAQRGVPQRARLRRSGGRPLGAAGGPAGRHQRGRAAAPGCRRGAVGRRPHHRAQGPAPRRGRLRATLRGKWTSS